MVTEQKDGSFNYQINGGGTFVDGRLTSTLNIQIETNNLNLEAAALPPVLSALLRSFMTDQPGLEMGGVGVAELAEAIEVIPTFDDVVSLAREAWRGDYGIVKHDNDPLAKMFSEPRDHMQYSLTLDELLSMTEEQFLEKLQEKPIALLIQCMDRRGAKLGYEKVRNELLQEEKLDPDEVNIVHVALGGGVLQRGEVVRDGQAVETKREAAFTALMTYIAAKADVKLVVSTGHDHRCGAEAFAANDKGWPEQLGCQPGDIPEQNKMRELIHEFSSRLLPEKWYQAGIVREFLAHLSSEPEANPVVDFIPATN